MNLLLFSILILLFFTGCCCPKGTTQLTNGKGYVRMDFKVPFGSGDVTKESKKKFVNQADYFYKGGGFIERSMLIERTKYEIKDRFGKDLLYRNGKSRDLKEIAKDPYYLSLSSFERDCFKLWYWDEVIKNMSKFESFSIKERAVFFYGFINKELSNPEVKDVMKELIERGKESVLQDEKIEFKRL